MRAHADLKGRAQVLYLHDYFENPSSATFRMGKAGEGNSLGSHTERKVEGTTDIPLKPMNQQTGRCVEWGSVPHLPAAGPLNLGFPDRLVWSPPASYKQNPI